MKESKDSILHDCTYVKQRQRVGSGSLECVEGTEGNGCYASLLLCNFFWNYGNVVSLIVSRDTQINDYHKTTKLYTLNKQILYYTNCISIQKLYVWGHPLALDKGDSVASSLNEYGWRK